MKVAQVCGNFPPELRGGMELVVGALATELSVQGLETVVICGSEKPRARGDVVREEWHGLPVVRVHRTPGECDPVNPERPRIRALVSELLVTEHIDVMHLHDMAPLSADLLRTARSLGIGSVFTFHDLWTVCARFFRLPVPGVTCPEGADRAPCWRCLAITAGSDPAVVRPMLERRDSILRAELAAAGRLTAPSRSCAESIRRHLPWAPPMAEIEVLPHGLLRTPQARRSAGAPAGTSLRIGTFGNLVAAKGVEDLVRSAAGLSGVEVVLAGAFLEAGFEDRVKSLAAELGVRLVCRGPYDEASPHPAAELDLAVFPSRCEESYGLVVDEALAHGVPALVSDRGAFAERRGQGGIEVCSLAELRAALADLVGRPGRLTALRATVPDRLPHIAATARRYRELYEQVREAR